MEIAFGTAGSDDDRDLESLYGWLADDLSLRGCAEIKKVTARSSGEMGSGVELVLAAVSTAAALVQVPLSYLAWRQGRGPKAPVTVTVLGVDRHEAEAVLRSFGAPPADEDLPEDKPGGSDRDDTSDSAGGAQ